MHTLRFAALIAVFVIPLAGLALIDKPLAPQDVVMLTSGEALSSQRAPAGVIPRQ